MCWCLGWFWLRVFVGVGWLRHLLLWIRHIWVECLLVFCGFVLVWDGFGVGLGLLLLIVRWWVLVSCTSMLFVITGCCFGFGVF